MRDIKVERRGSYQGVSQYGITGCAEITPTRAVAEKWARLARAELARAVPWQETSTEQGPGGELRLSRAIRVF